MIIEFIFDIWAKVYKYNEINIMKKSNLNEKSELL